MRVMAAIEKEERHGSFSSIIWDKRKILVIIN